jgi:tetraacyldisaccharide 4'-kinase
VAHALRAMLTPLAWLHRVGLEGYLLPYRTGLRKRYELPVPVISIGNLTSGGTGKTPMAALVGQLLQNAGRRVVILSRGHGGSHEKEPGAKIVSRGDGQVLLPPEVAGDEPVLLARLLPDVPVVVGRDRRVSGRLACEQLAPDVLLLDDGLQFWQLHRDLDIVLLDTVRPFDNGWVLPRGLLREPPAHLRRAGAAVLTRSDRATAEQLAVARSQVHRLAPEAVLLTAIHTPAGWLDRGGEVLNSLPGKEYIAFSGIADGDAFVKSLEKQGLLLKTALNFADHHAYNKDGVLALIAADPSATFVTTEKDLVKVASLWPEDGPPLVALRVRLEIDDLEPLRRLLDTTLYSP